MARKATNRAQAAQGQASPDKQARIRMYRVGFGDFFLLSVRTKDGGLAHILVDCGVHAHDLGVMPAAVQQLKADTGGKLALVIVTHRHADHISGFGSASEVFKTFTVERVWMSWFEDPSDTDATKVQAGIAATAERLQAHLAARAQAGNATADDAQYARMAGNALGIAKGGNAAALEMIHGFTGPDGKPTPVDYYQAGQPAILPPSLAAAGLQAEILGPPKDSPLLSVMDNAAHQYLTSSEGEGGAPREPFAPAYRARGDFVWKAEGPPPLDLRALMNQIRSIQPDALAAAAKRADNALNNQSLVVLFTFAGKTMLFSGDAQWGNWANFLFGGPAIGAPGHTKLTERSAGILGKLDFYKVGHHGSTNATPIDVVNAMKQGCYAMCSTDPGAYGNPDKGTEVPRTPLMSALEKQSGQKLARSDQVPVGTKPATEGLPPLAAPFAPGPSGSVDLWL